MLKTNLSDIFSDLNSETSVILPKSIKIKNINSVDTVANTTSSFIPQKGAYSDATSSFMPQKGGYSDATSSFMPQKGGYLNGTKNKDIQQLISMLSATSDDNYTANSTDNTEQLKDKLFNIIQSGGSPPPEEIKTILMHIEGYKNALISTDNATTLSQLKQKIYDAITPLNETLALTFLQEFAKIYITSNLTHDLITKPYLLYLLNMIKYVKFVANNKGKSYQNELINSIFQSLGEIINRSNPINMDMLYENHKKQEDNIKKIKLYDYYNSYFLTNFKKLQDYNSKETDEYTALPIPRLS